MNVKRALRLFQARLERASQERPTTFFQVLKEGLIQGEPWAIEYAKGSIRDAHRPFELIGKADQTPDLHQPDVEIESRIDTDWRDSNSNERYSAQTVRRTRQRRFGQLLEGCAPWPPTQTVLRDDPEAETGVCPVCGSIDAYSLAYYDSNGKLRSTYVQERNNLRPGVSCLWCDRDGNKIGPEGRMQIAASSSRSKIVVEADKLNRIKSTLFSSN